MKLVKNMFQSNKNKKSNGMVCQKNCGGIIMAKYKHSTTRTKKRFFRNNYIDLPI